MIVTTEGSSMPGRSTHTLAGAFTGLLFGMVRANAFKGGDWVWHNIGAGLGGGFAGRLPDILEPAFTPHHRHFFHGLVPNAIFWYMANGKLEKAYQAVLTEAFKHEISANRYPWQRAILFMLAGLIQALPAGYISHLALDGTTSSGLPFIGKLPA